MTKATETPAAHVTGSAPCPMCGGSGEDGIMSACSFCGGTGALAILSLPSPSPSVQEKGERGQDTLIAALREECRRLTGQLNRAIARAERAERAAAPSLPAASPEPWRCKCGDKSRVGFHTAEECGDPAASPSDAEEPGFAGGFHEERDAALEHLFRVADEWASTPYPLELRPCDRALVQAINRIRELDAPAPAAPPVDGEFEELPEGIEEALNTALEAAIAFGMAPIGNDQQHGEIQAATERYLRSRLLLALRRARETGTEDRLRAFAEKYGAFPDLAWDRSSSLPWRLRWRRQYADAISDRREVYGATLDLALDEADAVESENDRRDPQHAKE